MLKKLVKKYSDIYQEQLKLSKVKLVLCCSNHTLGAKYNHLEEYTEILKKRTYFRQIEIFLPIGAIIQISIEDTSSIWFEVTYHWYNLEDCPVLTLLNQLV